MTDLTDLPSRRSFFRALAGLGIGVASLSICASAALADDGPDDEDDEEVDDSRDDDNSGPGGGDDDSGGNSGSGNDDDGDDDNGTDDNGDDDSSGHGGDDDGDSPRINDSAPRLRNVTVRYSDGWIELILDGQYKLIDNLNRQVILRRATVEDFNRMVALGS